MSGNIGTAFIRINPFGCEIQGYDLSTEITEDQINELKDLLAQHKLLLFRNNAEISENRQVEIGRYFGDIETAGFVPHSKSSNDFILRVSNEADEGLRNFGTSGFHIDCSFLPNPSCVSLYHMIQASKDGDTGITQDPPPIHSTHLHTYLTDNN